jgi:penicillin-binding protein 2
VSDQRPLIALAGALPRPRWSLRLVAAGALAVVAIGFLAVKLAEVQVVDGPSLAALARENSVHRVVLEAERGIIYDRHGAPLVQNAPAWSIEVVPEALPVETAARSAEIVELARLSGADPDAMTAAIAGADPYGGITVGPGLTEEQQLAISERIPALPGVSVARRAVRTYLYGALLSHVTGYVGPIDPAEWNLLKRSGYQPDELVGKVGVEAGLESLLRGVDGWADVVVDARGLVVRTLASRSPVPGDSIYLSIDLPLDTATMGALVAGLNRDHKRAGASVVVDPRSGEVLAMVSWPAYDPNLFTHGISAAQYDAIVSDPDLPLLNRAIAGQYAPGSTFKMVTAAAGLQEGKITPQTLLDCPSYLTFGGWTYHNWASYGLGYMNVAKALAVSCDTFFYQVAARVGDVTLARYARAFGFGSATSLEMPGVEPGLVPDRLWKAVACGVPDGNSDACRWTIGDTVTLGIGQSALLTTPLNQALYVAAIANGGSLLKPTLVHEVVAASGRVVSRSRVVVTDKVRVSAYNLAAIREGMREEINRPYNMNYWFRAAGVPADGGGKTGTAQWGGSGLDLPTHAWFVFFAPFANPDVAMSIFVERGELSEVEAAPIGVAIMRFFNPHRAAIQAPLTDG